MSAIFRIGQSGSFGPFGIARSHLSPFSIDGAITLEAQTLTHASYLWEVSAAPIDGSPPVVTPAGATCTLQLEEPGGYLIRLTVDAGLTSEDVLELYVGIVMANSDLPLPSLYETNQDNSLSPYDGSQGWWYKQERFNKWVDKNIGTGGFNWWDFVETSVPITLDASHNGKTIVVTAAAPFFEDKELGKGGPEPMGEGGGGPGGPVAITLPALSPAYWEYWVRIQQGTGIPRLLTGGSPIILFGGGGGGGGTDIMYKTGISPSVPTNAVTPAPTRAGMPNAFIEVVGTPSGWLIFGGDGVWLDEVDGTVRYVLGGNVTDYVTPIYGALPLAAFDAHGQLASTGTTLGDMMLAVYAGYTFVVKALNMLSDVAQAGVPPVMPIPGDAWVVNTWGGGYTDGDVVVWTGAAWIKVAALGDYERLRVVVSGTTPGTVASGSFAGFDKQVMEYNGGWYPIENPQAPGTAATLALVVMDPVYTSSGGWLYSYGWGSDGAGIIWYPVGGNIRPDVFATFSDDRVSGTPGGPVTADEWMARTLTDDTEINTGSGQITLQKFDITGLDVKTFKVAGDQSAHFSPGRYVSVRGSTGNDREGDGDDTAPYTIDTVTYNVGTDDTSVVVLEALLDATVHGYLYTGRIVVTPGTYEFDVVTECVGSKLSVCRLAERTGFTYDSGYVDVGGPTVTQQGSSTYSSSPLVPSHSHIHGTFQTILTAEYWEVQQYVEDNDSGAATVLGLPIASGFREHYCRISFRRIGEGSMPT